MKRAANWSIDADASFRHVVGLIDAAWPFRWHDAAHTPRQLMSRRKSMVAREPNGRPQRARSPVEVKRLLDGAASGLKDQFWARRWGGCIFAAGSTEPSIEVRLGGHRVGLTVSASLPLFPQERRYSGYHGPSPIVKWCPWPESNQHSLRNSILSRARLPVPPQGPSASPRAGARSRRNIAAGFPGSTRADVNVAAPRQGQVRPGSIP